jgi:quercetin dioxygenase-like cupin family protein
MSRKIRRVVTGHDKDGKAIVLKDEMCSNVSSKRPGQEGCLVWTTDTVPADNTDAADGGTRQVGTALPGGTVFRVVQYQPGVAPQIHRSNSIDYAVVLAGTIVMQLDGGVEVTLNAGDVLVQRGTLHNWLNRGPDPCVIAFVLIDAKPMELGGKELGAFN